MLECISCAGTKADGAAFPEKKRGEPRQCWDCLIEQRRAAMRDQAPRHIQTRASYRAALRYRQRMDQLDLVDRIAPCP